MLKKRQFGEIISDCVGVVYIFIEIRQDEPLGSCGSDCKARTPALALKTAVEALEVLEKVRPSTYFCLMWSRRNSAPLSQFMSSNYLPVHDDMKPASYCGED